MLNALIFILSFLLMFPSSFGEKGLLTSNCFRTESRKGSLLNNTLEVTVTPSKLATTADVEMSEHGTVVETASQHKDKSPASGREVSSIPDIPNTKGTEPETSARLAVSEIPSEDRRSDALA
jgi:hypothetical protein